MTEKPIVSFGRLPQDRSVEAYKRFINGMMESLGLGGEERQVMTEQEWQEGCAEYWSRIDAALKEKAAKGE